ncbi:hypothetical protein [Cytobacillus citreus]|uniref:hypothetical protein n=1 Tax=Cytobacillus citreus TaxID=2833586 RepID=UPI002016BE30|nr:hypothetical protein [Cytobacillus citreus]
MKLKKYMIGFSTGYIFCMLITYFFFDFFSWSFAVGSAMGIVLFILIINLH